MLRTSFWLKELRPELSSKSEWVRRVGLQSCKLAMEQARC